MNMNLQFKFCINLWIKSKFKPDLKKNMILDFLIIIKTFYFFVIMYVKV